MAVGVWADAFPNLLIGLREGLEGGLVVSILLAAVRRSGASSTSPVWLGAAAAVGLAGSFGAVLTFSEAALPAAAQDGLAGVLSVLSVVLVTGMVFWMRSAARGLSSELQGKVSRALAVGGGAIGFTAFAAVAREGLETALFLWTTVQASPTTLAPLVGAAVGLGIAVGLCVLMVRRSVRINLGVFFSRTAVLLVVVAAGVLAYGLGDLQQAGLLPGHSWVAFDLTGVVPANTWWATLITGITNLTPSMTWLQVVAYVGYLVVVLVLLNRKPVAAASPKPAPAAAGPGAPAEAVPAEPEPAEAAAAPEPGGAPPRPARTFKPVLIAGVVLGVPAALAGIYLLVAGRTTSASARQIAVTDTACADAWVAPPAGTATFTLVNSSHTSTEVYLVQAPASGVVAEVENLGPGTRHAMTVDLPPGEYAWRCVPAGAPAVVSASARIAGGADGSAAAPAAVAPVSLADLDGPTHTYQAYVAPQLDTLTTQVATLATDIGAGDLDAARRDWLPAQLTWERVGAAYGSFGDVAAAIDGGPDGLPSGVADAGFTGLRRLEYGLWHGQPAPTLQPVVAKLATDVATLRAQFPTLTADPTALPLRGHEILEDALRDHLSGRDDQGAGAAYAETLADLDGTRVVVDELGPLIDARDPDLRATVAARAATLRQALAAIPAGTAPAAAPLEARQSVNAATAGLVETLSHVPTLLEVR